jgi:hypothetical protein
VTDGNFTAADDLAYIRFAWRGAYAVNPPAVPGRHWQATATFGTRDVLEADSADGLLGKIRRHYPGLIDKSAAASKQ